MHRHLENRLLGMSAGRYLGRLSKALPGKGWARNSRDYWPDSTKLVISISLLFEAGGAPNPNLPSPFSGDTSAENALANWWDYGFKEGIPRLLDIFERRHVRVTSHILAAAAERNPKLAHEVVERGHEAGLRASTEYVPNPEEERRGWENEISAVQRATGLRPVGFHGSQTERRTLEVLQDLGFLYCADDLSRDEPCLVPTGGKSFLILPYTTALDDLIAYEAHSLATDVFASELRNEFEMLYSESETRRRMMSITVHDRVSGRPARAKVLEEFIIYAQRRPGVVFMRQDDIAQFAINSAATPLEGELKKGREAA